MKSDKVELGGDYPQDKQRKETGVARKTLILAVSAEAAPAAVLARTPRGVGISGKKKGSEIIRALQFGGGGGGETSKSSDSQDVDYIRKSSLFVRR